MKKFFFASNKELDLTGDKFSIGGASMYTSEAAEVAAARSVYGEGREAVLYEITFKKVKTGILKTTLERVKK